MPNDQQSKLLQKRTNFRFLTLLNPDYFGNLTESKMALEGFQPVEKMVANTHYEELTCLGFHPETNTLRAVVVMKQTSGYIGGPCTEGSKEYVRFYIDYDHDGSWIDVGVVNFDAHNLPITEPLHYGVALQIQPEKQSCCDEDPVLPLVRAILSWNLEPPANQPNWLPPWGNKLEANIQIKPSTSIFCYLKKNLEKIGVKVNIEDLKPVIQPEELKWKHPPLTDSPILQLMKLYAGKVEPERTTYKHLYAMAKVPAQPEVLQTINLLKANKININKITSFLLEPNFNTHYEEVKCVGLDRNLNLLHAGILVKKPYGYSGDLCYTGSKEYVAFYMDFGAGWQYMGTSSVTVHDIPQIPGDGLWYNVALPVSLSKYQKKWCITGKAKVKAILSWSTPPTPNDPDHVAHWGDWEEAYVEIRPLPPNVPEGKMLPVIETLGGMPISTINNNGYANGTSSSGLTGIDSPFDGKIVVTGQITYAPDKSAPSVSAIKYRLMVKKPGESIAKPSHQKFWIYVTEIIGAVMYPQTGQQMIPDTDGWMEYQPDYTGPDFTFVAENVLAVYVPTEEGLHETYIEIWDPNTSTSAKSNTVKFRVDKKTPEVDIEITSGTGNCGFFKKGDIISGTFSMKSTHCYSLTLSVTPKTNPLQANPEIISTGTHQLIYNNGLICPLISGKWELNTANMEPCGYNIRIRGENRTIVNSRWFGREAWDIEGFCVTK
jgi:hypothetical protein